MRRMTRREVKCEETRNARGQVVDVSLAFVHLSPTITCVVMLAFALSLIEEGEGM